MCEIKYDRTEECFIIKDPFRGLKFKAFASARAIVRVKRLWEEIADAISTTRATHLKIRGEWVTLVPMK